MPGQMTEEFARRRRQLMRLMGRDAIAVLSAAPERTRNNDVYYNYRQDSDFHYLTGFAEPDSVAVLIPGRPQGEFLMFVRDRNDEREIWDGKRAGPAGARSRYGADDAFPIGDLDDILPGLLESRARVYHTMGKYHDFDQRVVGWVNALRAEAHPGGIAPLEFVALDHVLHDMRLFKSRKELSIMRRAGAIGAGAHVRAMRFCRPGRTEYEVCAELVHEFGRHGAEVSYQPIVGSGANSCVLHYRDNNQPLKDGDLLLIDAGCEHEYYASDITRTFPVNGTVQSRAARRLPRGACRPESGHRQGAAGQSLERATRCGGARHHPGSGAHRPAQGPAVQPDQGWAPTGNSSCTAPGTGSASTCTTWATTRSGTNGGCSSRAWC